MMITKITTRFLHESDESYPKDALHIYAENEPAVKQNEAVQNYIPVDFCIIEANGNFPDNSKYPLATMQAAQNLK